MNLENELKKLICDIALNDIQPTDINRNTCLCRDLGFESIRLVELFISIETKFNISLYEKISFFSSKITFNQLLKFVKDLRK